MRPIGRRRIAPAQAVADDMEDAADDALVVHRDVEGRFRFAMRDMTKLGPRSYAKWLIRFAADLAAGYVAVVVGRDTFLADIERLARDHVSAADRDALELELEPFGLVVDRALVAPEMPFHHAALPVEIGKLGIEEMQGGTFTISNGGVYGSLMSTPILNAPQSGILGMHKIQDRPMVIGGKIEVRPMMYLALSYDHRIVDGREAVTFLVRVKDMLEDPARLVMDV